MELITSSANIDYKKMFDRENFYYIDQNDEVKMFTEIASFDIDSDKYDELKKHIAACGRCFIMSLLAADESTFERTDISFENLIGNVVSITSNVFPESDTNSHYCVEFALTPEKIVEKLSENQSLALFYFKDDDVYSDKIFVSATQFKY